MWAFIVPIHSRTSSSTAKTAELSDPFQPKPLHDPTKCQTPVLWAHHSNPIRVCRYKASRTKQEQLQENNTETKVPHIPWKTLPQQIRATLTELPAAQQHQGIQIQGICIPSDKTQQAETQGNIRKRKQMLQRFANIQSDSDLNFTPAFPSLLHAWFQALFSVQKMPLWEATQM